MARKNLRSLTRISAISTAFAIFLTGLVAPASAQSVVRIRPATQWGSVYAGPATSAKQTATPKVAHLEKKAKFIVKYNNFPEWTKIQVQAAIDTWAENFDSKVPIYIDATWGRSSSFSILGSARPGSYFANFSGAPDPSLWYPSALANALAGKDLDGDSPEMVITVNSLANWYRGNGVGPSKSEYDLQSVILHEMAHGLGFLSTDSYDNFFGYGSIDQPTPYDAYVQTGDGRRLSDLPSPSLELGEALTSKLVWSGVQGIAANGGVKPLLYTPKVYEDGSSISHLDEATFSKAGRDAVMSPNLDAGEIFHEPGPLLLAMMQDLRTKPPVGIAVGIPQTVRNAEALLSDSGAIVKFDPPANARAAQITSYTVKNVKTGAEKSFTNSPAVMPGLKNGTSYTFTVTASNSLGTSDAVTTNAITPQAGWKTSVIDPAADAKNLTSVTFNTNPAVIYQDANNGALKVALWNGKVWNKLTVDGRGGSAGRTRNAITGEVSACVSGYGKAQTLHIFYADSVDKDLRYATYDGKTFKYEVVDGNGPAVNGYEDPIRVRSASDVSISNACSVSAAGVQVFYRDESQGILLGAVKAKGITEWSYELVDGDRKTDGRTTGDVGFHLDALFDGKDTILLYDSVLTINTRKEATSGAIRVAQRNGLSPTAWRYSTLDSSGGPIAVVGYDVALQKGARGILATWLTSSTLTLPKAEQIRWTYLSAPTEFKTLPTNGYGTPGKFLSSDGQTTIFNCQERLCAVDIAKNTLSLVTKEQNPDGFDSAWIVLNKIRYLVSGINNQLLLLRAT
ncbi:fibronectin type III domain-containing protein [Actinobacteria bacterium IMCC26103]|nr:fibronectin type III domain-containing protein [Actinobacteria bacterium IMCC26103]